jgi:hypothetical protein
MSQDELNDIPLREIRLKLLYGSELPNNEPNHTAYVRNSLGARSRHVYTGSTRRILHSHKLQHCALVLTKEPTLLIEVHMHTVASELRFQVSAIQVTSPIHD